MPKYAEILLNPYSKNSPTKFLICSFKTNNGLLLLLLSEASLMVREELRYHLYVSINVTVFLTSFVFKLYLLCNVDS